MIAVWTTALLEAALGRPERPLPVDAALARLSRERVLITGAAGSIGTALTELLASENGSLRATDVDTLDVRLRASVQRTFGLFRPTLVFHLAGAKHAPEGEHWPQNVLEVNGVGTAHVLEAAGTVGAHVVTASTCKACDPETAYGASKLLAERLTLAAGGSVARFYNVVETADNVFETWAQMEPALPLPVTACRRHFISLAEATALILTSAIVSPGRYTVDPGSVREMADVAAALYPGRVQAQRPPRRGDRIAEPRLAASETLALGERGLERVLSAHDAVPGQTVPARAA